jgi:hypothetical protein
MTTPTSTGELWLTTMLRPAGVMSGAGAEQFSSALRAASASSQLVLVDLRGVGPLPRSARRALETADTDLGRGGGALLVVDPEDRQHLPGHLLRQLPPSAG